ncbi:MAG: YjbH domain-containing protein [Gammaproteobacteria bacterium]|nr:YjbH domain-containing protein [Gammaproteobacteria bacterium]
MSCSLLRQRIAVMMLALIGANAFAVDPWSAKIGTRTTLSDHGGVGLLQMPTARMAPDGEFAITVTRVDSYDRYSFTLQALKSFEFVFRYNSLNDHLYGPRDFSGDLTYKDRGFDVKFRLVEESNFWPEIAVGARDFLGTGLFSSEYFVASKRYYDWDFSAGLMWGNIGGRTDLNNPLGSILSRFNGDRVNTGRFGGEANGNTWFKGDHASLFAGVSYQLPNQPIWLMAEYDANDYQREPFGDRFTVNSPMNLGIKYRYNNWLDLGLSYERGDTLGLSIGVRTNFMDKTRSIPKFDAPPSPTAQPNLQTAVYQFTAQTAQDAASVVSHPQIAALKAQLKLAGLDIESIYFDKQGKRLTLELQNKRYRSTSRAIGRAARLLLSHTREKVLQFRFVLTNDDALPIDDVTLMRHQLVQVLSKKLSPTVVSRYAERELEMVSAPDKKDASSSVTPVMLKTRTYPDWSASISPAMRHNIGGPDGFYQFQVMLNAPIELKLRPGLSLSSSFTANVYNTFDKLKLESDSVLPHVRSDIKHYLQQQGTVSLNSLQADYLTQLSRSSYARASVGIFEEMFAGVGGEFLYAPAGKRWALGVDAYWVKQRDYDQKFAFRDYQANTGHATWYHRWPWFSINTKLSLGQYLAGDRGYTFDVSRVFDNGVTVGGFFTRTNISAAEFGEGSFDKGIYISVPLDLMTTRYTKNSLGMVWRPLTRDGGAMLYNRKPLYPAVTSGRADDLFNGALDIAD